MNQCKENKAIFVKSVEKDPSQNFIGGITRNPHNYIQLIQVEVQQNKFFFSISRRDKVQQYQKLYIIEPPRF